MPNRTNARLGSIQLYYVFLWLVIFAPTLREAVDIQLTLPYSEPPFWHYPVRQSLGTALLRQGDAEASREVFEADLVVFPENGWSLHGLRQVLTLGGDSMGEVDARLQAAWQYSDTAPGTGW